MNGRDRQPTAHRSIAHSVSGALSEETSRQALSDLGVFERSFNGVTGFSSSLWKSWGYSDSDHHAGLWLYRIHPKDVDRVARAYISVLGGASSRFCEEYRVRVGAGSYRWILSSGQVIERDSDGRPLRYLGSEMDVTDRKHSQDELARAKATAERVAQEAETLREAGAIVASSLEIDRIVALVLDQTIKVVPYDTASVHLLRGDGLETIGGHGWANTGHVTGTRLPVPGENPHSEVLARRLPLRLADVRESYPAFRSIAEGVVRSWIGVPLIAHGEVLGLLTLHKRQRGFFDETHMRLAASFADHVAVALHNAQLYERTHRLAMTDPLTGLETRRSFMVHSDTLAEQAARYGRPLSIIMMDLDHFKRINDDHGHFVGDQVLTHVARTTREMLRKADVLCRYGGEEFVALLPETPLSEARRIAERIRLSVSQVRLEGVRYPITVSLGISTVELESERSIEHAMNRADQALYRSKQQGRNRCSTL